MKRAWLLGAVLLVACSSAPPLKGADGRPLPAPINTPFKLRPFQQLTLKNGLPVLLIEDKALPYVSFSLMVQSGSLMDPPNLPGLANFVGGLLDKGTKELTATQFADQIGEMGADLGVNTAYDYTLVQASSLSLHQNALLQSFSRMIVDPTFSNAEMGRLRQLLVAARQKMPDNAGYFTDRAFDQFLFGTHPYGQPVEGTVKSLNAIRRKNIIQYYLRHYRPNNSVLAVVGQFSPDIKERLEDAFKDWEPRELQPVPELVAPELKPGVRLVTNPTLVQTQIVIGHKGIKRTDPDFLALRVANTILGGSFISKLNDRLRVQLGLTYGVNSYFDARLFDGPFQISTFTRNDKALDAVKEALAVVRDLVQNGASDVDVASAKAYLAGTFPVIIETAEKLAVNLLVLKRYGISESYLRDYMANVNRITVDQVNAALRKHLNPDAMKVLVYSDRKALQPLRQLGPVEVKTFTEVP